MSDGSTPPAMPQRPRFSTSGGITRNIVPLAASQPAAPPRPLPPSPGGGGGSAGGQGSPGMPPKPQRPAETVLSVVPGGRVSIHSMQPIPKGATPSDFISSSASLVHRRPDKRLSANDNAVLQNALSSGPSMSSPSLTSPPPSPPMTNSFSSSSLPASTSSPLSSSSSPSFFGSSSSSSSLNSMSAGSPLLPEKPPRPSGIVVPVGSLSQQPSPVIVTDSPPSLPSRPSAPASVVFTSEEAPAAIGGGIGSAPESKTKPAKRRKSVGKALGMKISKTLLDSKKKDEDPASGAISAPSVSAPTVVNVQTENAKWERSAEAEAIMQLLQAEKEKLTASSTPVGKTIDLSVPPPPPPLPEPIPERPAKPIKSLAPSQKPQLPAKPSLSDESPLSPGSSPLSPGSSPLSPPFDEDEDSGDRNKPGSIRGRVQPANGAIGARGRGGAAGAGVRGRGGFARGGMAQRNGDSDGETETGTTVAGRVGHLSDSHVRSSVETSSSSSASSPSRGNPKPGASRRAPPVLCITPDGSSPSTKPTKRPVSLSTGSSSSNSPNLKVASRRSVSRRSQRSQFGQSVLELFDSELPWFRAMWEREPEEKRRLLLQTLDSRVTQVLISNDSSVDPASSAIIELIGPLCLNASDLLNMIVDFANYAIEAEEMFPTIQSFFQTLSDLLNLCSCNVDPISVLSPRVEKSSSNSSNSHGVPIPGSAKAQTNPIMAQAFQEIQAKLKSHVASPHNLITRNDTMINSVAKERTSAITAIINHIKEALVDDLRRLSSLVSQLASVCLNAILPLNFPTTWFFVAYLGSLLEDFQSVFKLASTIHQLVIMLNQRFDNPETSRITDSSQNLEESVENIWQHNAYKAVFQNWPKGTGSINSLVQDLTSIESHDANFLKTFMTTYLSFMTPWMLFTKLMERYDVPPEKINELKPNGGAEAVKLRVCVTLKYWIQNRFHDFDAQLIERLEEFTETKLKTDGHGTMSEALLKLLRERQLELVADVIQIEAIPDIVPQRDALQFYLFNNTEIATLAEQMTALDAEVFKNFEVTGLLNQAWEKPAYEHRSLFVRRTIRRLNRLSYWFATLVLSQEKLQDRAKIMSKIIQLGRAFLDLRNFHACASIVVALNTAAVSRLKHTFTKLSSEASADWKFISELMEPSSSYKKYRAALENAHNPLVPYVGVYCSDLIYINEGNPDKIGDLINMNKHNLVYNVIGTILLYQQECFNVRPREPFRTVFNDLPVIDEKHLYDISLSREPRNSKISEIE